MDLFSFLYRRHTCRLRLPNVRHRKTCVHQFQFSVVRFYIRVNLTIIQFKGIRTLSAFVYCMFYCNILISNQSMNMYNITV